MKIQIIENITNNGNEITYSTRIVAKNTTLSMCNTASVRKGTDAFETALSTEIFGDKVYKEFEAEDEGEVKEFIENLCYDTAIENKLKWVDFDDIK